MVMGNCECNFSSVGKGKCHLFIAIIRYILSGWDEETYIFYRLFTVSNLWRDFS